MSLHFVFPGCPTSKEMVERLVAFLRQQLQKTVDPMKLHQLQSDVARLERKFR